MKDFFAHLFLPRESNNHRAKIFHHSSLLYLIAFLLVGQFFIFQVKTHYSNVLGISANVSLQDLLSLTNQAREQQGLAPLLLNADLSQAASEKAADMFTNNYWAHVSPTGVTPWVWIKQSGYDYVYAGENLARGYNSAPDVMNAWMASPGHRENILSPNYRDVGFAVATGNLTGDDTVLVVEEFGSQITASNPQEVSSDNNQLPPTVPTTVPPIQIAQIPQTAGNSGVPVIASQEKTATKFMVAAVSSQPLINKNSLTQTIAIGIIIVFISLLVLDMILIERKKIVRLISHNLDHIIYLIMLLIVIVVLGRGAIL